RRNSSFAVFVTMLSALPARYDDPVTGNPSDEAVYAGSLLIDWLFVHMNMYPMRGLGHWNDRIDFITGRLVFEEILLRWLEAAGPVETVRRLATERSGRGRRILAALRNGFIHESLTREGDHRGPFRWLGRKPEDWKSRAPLFRHPEIAAGLLA